MMKYFRKKIAIALIACLPFSVSSCDEDTINKVNEIAEYIMELLGMLGWDFENETTDIPDDGGSVFDDDEVLASSKSWESYFPPIGNQGEYGTCVTWATGYALKTALNKIDNNSLNVNSASNQTSPIDLWHLMGSDEKSTKCNGSNFDPAFKAMERSGVASMAEKPFTNMKMTCDGICGIGDSGNKLGSYRIIAYTKELSGSGSYGMTVANFKGYLDNVGPIAIGARLGDNFMNCNSSSVLNSDTYNYSGMHAYHAMVLVGYDDNRQAFRVRNSWGSDWGDNGSIWIGYNFFVNNFCFGAWVASNDATASAETTRSSSANDVKMEVLKDYKKADGKRVVEYNILNNGSSTISSNKEWSAVYLLFRKNRLSEKYLLFHDYYGTDCKKGAMADYTNGLSFNGEANAVTNIDIAAGSSSAEALNGNKLVFEYSLPLDKNGNKLNGEFYMVLIADAFGNLDESDEKNNFCFLTGANGAALKIVDGEIQNMPSNFTEIRSLNNEKDLNNYSGVEVQNVLQKHLDKGLLQKLVSQSGLRNGYVAKSVK